MPILDFFKNIFGRGSSDEPPQHRFEENPQYRDSFRNPIWQSDDDEDDISDFSRQPRHRYQFRVFSDPFEMTRFFETQMDDMMRNFFGGFGRAFGPNSNTFGFEHDLPNALPGIEDKSPTKGPRDEVLKPDYDQPSSLFGFDGFGNFFSGNRRSYEEVLKPAYEMPDSQNQKQDTDIDGKIKSDELAKIWKTPSSEAVDTFRPSIKSFGSSVSTQIVRRPDGSIEERRTVKDSNGNEEIRVTRRIGDKMHTVITKRAKDGSETKTEDIVNMDENEIKGFDEKWTKIQIHPKDNPTDDFPWHKFFGPSPKL